MNRTDDEVRYISALWDTILGDKQSDMMTDRSPAEDAANLFFEMKKEKFATEKEITQYTNELAPIESYKDFYDKLEAIANSKQVPESKIEEWVGASFDMMRFETQGSHFSEPEVTIYRDGAFGNGVTVPSTAVSQNGIKHEGAVVTERGQGFSIV